MEGDERSVRVRRGSVATRRTCRQAGSTRVRRSSRRRREAAGDVDRAVERGDARVAETRSADARRSRSCRRRRSGGRRSRTACRCSRRRGMRDRRRRRRRGRRAARRACPRPSPRRVAGSMRTIELDRDRLPAAEDVDASAEQSRRCVVAGHRQAAPASAGAPACRSGSASVDEPPTRPPATRTRPSGSATALARESAAGKLAGDRDPEPRGRSLARRTAESSTPTDARTPGRRSSPSGLSR